MQLKKKYGGGAKEGGRNHQPILQRFSSEGILHPLVSAYADSQFLHIHKVDTEAHVLYPSPFFCQFVDVKK